MRFRRESDSVSPDLFNREPGEKEVKSQYWKNRMKNFMTHIHGVPDLICEVLSDSTASRDLGEKAER